VAKALWNGKVVAETDHPLHFDNNVYFPPESLNRDYFVDSAHRSVCPWKGTASYFTLVDGAMTSPNAAWVYREPLPKAEVIRNHTAFWKDVTVQA